MGRGQPALPLGRVKVLRLHLVSLRAHRRGVSGDLAYAVGYEHTSVSMDGAPVEPYTLRVTHVYRREDGGWKLIRADPWRSRIDRPTGFAGFG
jgi:ketosteroid isomerase-like protein